MGGKFIFFFILILCVFYFKLSHKRLQVIIFFSNDIIKFLLSSKYNKSTWAPSHYIIHLLLKINIERHFYVYQ